MSLDNYGWLIVATGPGGAHAASHPRPAIIVDPTEANAVTAALERHNAVLGAICATHHHHDHVGGIGELITARAPSGPISVVAGASDVAACRIPHATVALKHRGTWSGHGVTLEALHVPGHTLGSTALHWAAQNAVFVGDTLFAGGCGRMFEGDAAMMWRSMQQLRRLPPETRVFCGHEYTLKNLRFALSLEPHNQAVSRAVARAQALRERKLPTVPTTIADECAHNVFLRADDPELMGRMGTATAVATFAALRSARDSFTG